MTDLQWFAFVYNCRRRPGRCCRVVGTRPSLDRATRHKRNTSSQALWPDATQPALTRATAAGRSLRRWRRAPASRHAAPTTPYRLWDMRTYMRLASA